MHAAEPALSGVLLTEPFRKEFTAGTLCPFAASSLRACSSCCLAVAVGDWVGAAAALCIA